ncbi:MarR family winged helix-turn-helix transcriptional regulator [Vreelandella sedimenti]|uniref:MarR family winged helix-turn-helix transcriptional regulator n=1 Tax=Vreelandella sedimenti TaxID=2729618 RepID=UPI00257EEA91|nr:MarR family transcriptional regulator [Halomonas sp. UBA3173]|tara:strand:- start:7487 stop:7987 length:501 start_codon:yes stop_codon:yes gene_type:complete
MTGTPLSDANVLPGNLLRRCHQISAAIFLRKCEASNLTQLQYIIFCALEEMGPVDQITLGGYTALDRNTIAVVVRKLEERGLVNRRRNPEDRRSMFVSLTEQGEQLRNDSESAVAEVQKEILAPLNENEQEVLCSLLKRIADSNNHLSRVPIRLGGLPRLPANPDK